MTDGLPPVAAGYAPTAQEAEAAALAAEPSAYPYRAGQAAWHHRQLCIAQRQAKPARNNTDVQPQEFLYSDSWSDYDSTEYSSAHLVVKKTKEFIFVESYPWCPNLRHPAPWERRTYALDRQELERDGSVFHRPSRQLYFTTPWEERHGRRAPPHLTTLGLAAGATAEDIKAAYRRLAKRHHPDCGGDPEKFKEIQAAYDMARKGMDARPD